MSLDHVRQRLLDGQSVRAIAAAEHVGNNTVIRERTELLIGGARFEPCPCQRRAGHKGMCSYRLANLPTPRRAGGRTPRHSLIQLVRRSDDDLSD